MENCVFSKMEMCAWFRMFSSETVEPSPFGYYNIVVSCNSITTYIKCDYLLSDYNRYIKSLSHFQLQTLNLTQ